MSRHLEGLNEEQLRAVTYRGGPLLVLAGAGSGKTRVITRRIASLAIDDGVPVDSVLAVTFTNKAAGEMRERVQRDTGVYSRWISTFHSACVRILRSWGAAIGIERDFTIYDTDDSKKLLRRALEVAELDPALFQVGGLLAAIRRAKTEGRSPETVTEDAVSAYEEGIARGYVAYTRLLREANALDFDDLLLVAGDLLEREDGVRAHLRERFPHILVDEFQDTNRVQYRLLRLLVGDERQVCVTGDPDQSIYSWRGADIGNILEFANDFPGTEVVRLEENYRSTRTILAAADSLIAHNERRLEKTMRTENEEGAPIDLLAAPDDRQEARMVVRAIERQIAEEGKTPGDFAVFFRTNSQSRPFEEAFAAHRMPHVVIGAFPFYERAEVKVLLSYLRLLVNGRDVLAFERAITHPRRRVGPKALEKIRALAASRHRGDLRLALSDPECDEKMRGAARAGVAAFRAILEQLEAMPDFPTRPLLELVLRETGIMQALHESGEEDRTQHIGELLSAMADYDSHEVEGGLAHFLEGTSLASEIDKLAPGEADEGGGRVALMTVHAAKGLEFPRVFVCGLEEGLFPLSHPAGDRDDPEEERRLFYVAITRARERLLLSHAERRTRFGTREYRSRSSFLWEIPREVFAQRLERGGADALGWADEEEWPVHQDPAGEHGGDLDALSAGGEVSRSRRAPAPSAEPGYQIEYDPEFLPGHLAGGRRRQSTRPAGAFGVGFASSADAEHATSRSGDDGAAPDECATGDLVIGDLVEHPRFGTGEVLELRSGLARKVLVSFRDTGQRLLDLKYGGLRRVDPF